MIDLHAHILPALDDGPGDLDEALAMASIASADGIKALAATPHVLPGAYDNSKDNILKAVQEMNQHIKRQGIPLDIYPGAEYMLDPFLPGMIKEGEALTLNDGGKYILVEFPSHGIPSYAGQTLYEIALLGVTPIIAHPERNGDFLRDPDKLEFFLEKGALAQLTSGSLTGLFGRKVQNLAMYCIEMGYCHFIGSDAHSAEHRVPVLSGAARIVEESFGDALGGLLVSGNPARILAGQYISSTVTGGNARVVHRKRGFFSRLLMGRK